MTIEYFPGYCCNRVPRFAAAFCLLSFTSSFLAHACCCFLLYIQPDAVCTLLAMALFNSRTPADGSNWRTAVQIGAKIDPTKRAQLLAKAEKMAVRCR